jgi:hypothetical protein
LKARCQKNYFEFKNEETIKNLRIYATYVLARAYPSTLCMARSNLVRQVKYWPSNQAPNFLQCPAAFPQLLKIIPKRDLARLLSLLNIVMGVFRPCMRILSHVTHFAAQIPSLALVFDTCGQILKAIFRTTFPSCKDLWHRHCTENLIYVFPEMKLCGLVPGSYIHVSVSDFYIPRYMNVEIGRQNILILFWK